MTFAALDRELGRWSDQGLRATLWWRDDDASRATPALVRMLEIARRHRVPVAVAVIPALASPDLVDALTAAPQCSVLQHGFEHRNHAQAGERNSEFGALRSVTDSIAELALGRERLQQMFGTRFQSILVPPWNRIGPGVVARLAEQSYRGLSTFAPRPAVSIAPGLVQCNAHVDPIAWRRGRAFIGAGEAAAAMAAHLALRRAARVDPAEPTGLLTHHLDFDDAAWAFVDDLFTRTLRHPAVAWLSATAAFEPGSDPN